MTKDIIYRQDAIELAMQYCPDDDGTCSKADEDIRNLLDELEDLPSAVVEAEPTEEQVKEYCRKRCLVIVDRDLFNEMKSRWSAEPVRHGHWTNISISVTGNSSAECSLCGTVVHDTFANVNRINYCPNCGAKMDESTMGQVKPSDGERREDAEH